MSLPSVSLTQYTAGLSGILTQLPATTLRGRVVPARRVVSRLGYLPAILIRVDQTIGLLSGRGASLKLEPQASGEMGVFVTGDLPYPGSMALLCSAHILRSELTEDGKHIALDQIIESGKAALPIYGIHLHATLEVAAPMHGPKQR